MTNYLAGIAVGIIVLQTMVFAPTIFTTIESQSAGKLLRALFPKFFVLLSLLGVGMLAALIAAGDGAVMRFVLASVTLVVPVVCLLLIPATNRATDRGDARSFKILHTASVVLTVLVLVANLWMPLA